MAYSDHLIDQASDLASKDSRRPRQASLRRAVSGAYYALFHEIIDHAVASILSNTDVSGPVGHRLRRVVDHKAALRAAKWFASGSPADIPKSIQAMRSPAHTPIEPALARVCAVFIQLQAARHSADYDLSAPFSRDDTRRHVEDARSAIQALRTLDAKNDTFIFLLGCVLGDSLTRNA